METFFGLMLSVAGNFLTDFFLYMWSLSKRLKPGKYVHPGMQQPTGKKGLILLVSNPESAMFAINYHRQKVPPEGIPESILERIWLIPSNDKEEKIFGKGTVKYVVAIIQKCMVLIQEKKISSLEITLDDAAWLTIQEELKQACMNQSLEISKINLVVDIKIGSSMTNQMTNSVLLKPLKIVIEIAVSPSDSQDTFDKVNRIFRKSGYLPSDVIADFTGGTKPMSFGMIMACLPAERELQYVSFNPSTREMHGPFLLNDYQYGSYGLKPK